MPGDGICAPVAGYSRSIMASVRGSPPEPALAESAVVAPAQPIVRLVGLAACLAVLVKVLLAAVAPITADESLHWMQGQHLALGYRDHPPITALLARLATDVLGANWLGLRIVPILSTLACSGIVWGILRELGADRRRAALGAAAVQLLPMLGFGVLMVPVVPHLALVLGAEWALVRAVRHDRWRDHLCFGLLFGLALLTYYLAAALVLVAGLVMVWRHRNWWRPGLLVGLLVAAIVFAPNLVWNLASGSDSAVHFQLVERNRKEFLPWQLLVYPLLALGLAGPLLLPALRCLPAALGRLPAALAAQPIGDQDWRPFFACMVGGVLALFSLIATVTQAGAHWAVLAYLNVPLVLLAPSAEALSPRWWRAAVIVWAIPAAAVVVVVAVGLPRISAWLPANSWSSRARAIHAQADAVAVMGLVDTMRAQGSQPVVATDRWSLAGLLSFHGAGRLRALPWPPPARHGQDFLDWQAGQPIAGDLLYISSQAEPPASVREHCAELELVAELGQPRPYLWLFRGREFRPPPANSR